MDNVRRTDNNNHHISGPWQACNKYGRPKEKSGSFTNYCSSVIYVKTVQSDYTVFCLKYSTVNFCSNYNIQFKLWKLLVISSTASSLVLIIKHLIQLTMHFTVNQSIVLQ